MVNRGLMLLANGFEESEAIVSLDVIKKANISIYTVSVDDLMVYSNHKLWIQADKTIDDIDLDIFDFLVIPGGPAVFEYHLSSDITRSVIEHFMNNDQLIACICAAPCILGEMGLLRGRKYTCFPGCEENSYLGEYVTDSVVVDGNIITSQSICTTVDFALSIIEYVKDRDRKEEVKEYIGYQNSCK